MSKRPKKVEFNLKDYLNSTEYEFKRQELNNELNRNTQLFNVNSNSFSNIRPNYILTFRHNNYIEKKRLKELKKSYKLQINTKEGINLKSEFISSFINSKQPNWNIIFTVLE